MLAERIADIDALRARLAVAEKLAQALRDARQDTINWLDLEYRLPEAPRMLDQIDAALREWDALTK